MACTARGEVRSHINYFSPRPVVDGLPPTTTPQSATHPHERHRNGLETNLSISLPLALSLSRFVPTSPLPALFRPRTRLSLLLCGFSRISSPYFSPLPSPPPLPLCPTGNRFFDGVPTAGLPGRRDEGVTMFLQRI